MPDEEPEMAESTEIGQLLKLAGRRPVPDTARMAAAREVARAEWTRSVERRPRRSAWWLTTAAVVVASALGLATWIASSRAPVPVPLVETATLRSLIGRITVTSADSSLRIVAEAGARLHAGNRIETGTGDRAALQMDQGISARIDQETVVVLGAPDRVTLERGAVYIDARSPSRGPAFHVRTSLGDVRHLGTQFEVRLRGGSLRVRVREGRIAVERAGTQWTSHAREELLLVPGKPPARHPIATVGPEWDWATGLARSPRLEGLTVPAFLDWASREQGLRWVYEHPAMKERFASTVLHGSLEGLAPGEALEAVLPTCGLSARVDGERLIISRLSSQ